MYTFFYFKVSKTCHFHFFVRGKQQKCHEIHETDSKKDNNLHLQLVAIIVVVVVLVFVYVLCCWCMVDEMFFTDTKVVVA